MNDAYIAINGSVLTPAQTSALVTVLENYAQLLESPTVTAHDNDRGFPHEAEHRTHLPEICSLLQTAPPKTRAIHITVEVPAERAEEFTTLWQDFLNQDHDPDHEIRVPPLNTTQGIASLRKLIDLAKEQTRQSRYIGRFLASCDNGEAFPFSLWDVCKIDDVAFEHCLACLRLVHHPSTELHAHYPNGPSTMERLIGAWDLSQEVAMRSALLLSDYLAQSVVASHRKLGEDVAAWRTDRRDAIRGER